MAEVPTSSGPLVFGRYALYGKIASGGMATVYFGRMLGAAGFTRTVAIKRLHPHLAEEPDFVSMMMDEARLVARVHHPNVAQTLDVVSEGGELLIVMEYVFGESLAKLLRAESGRGRKVAPAVASSVMAGVLHGLHAAHVAKSERGVPLGIVHRDVSPHNVLVGVDGLARVIDFGVAKAVDRIQTTRAGVVKGKLPYMAPEQLAGQGTTQLADVYAAGVVLWELLTSRRLFKADDDIALFSLVAAGASEPPSRYAAGIPPALDALVMRALARDPSARFHTAREMADALVRVVPPALGTEVGAWVEDAARQVLDERSTRLAEIESQSSVPISAPPVTRAPVPVVDDAPTTVSQPSSLSLESPRGRSLAPGPSRRSALLVTAAVGVAVVAGMVVGVAWRSGSAAPGVSAASGSVAPPRASGLAAPASAAAAASVSAPATPSVAPPSSFVSAAGVASIPPAALPATAPAPVTGAPPSAPPPAARPATTTPRTKSAPNPAGSVIFATPD